MPDIVIHTNRGTADWRPVRGPRGPQGATGPGADVTGAEIEAARDDAVAAQQAAETARTAAESAAAEAEAGGTSTDAVMANRLADPASLSNEALSNVAAGVVAPVSRAARPGRNLLAGLGDSISSFNLGGDAGAQNPGWFQYLVTRSRGALRRAGNGVYATAGFTLEQIEATHLPSVLALDPFPSFVVVFGCSNNTSANGGAGFNITTASATLKRICAAIEAKGGTPIVVLIPPNETNALIKSNVARWNTWIAQFAAARAYPVLDAFTPLVDPANGNYIADLKQDPVHPSEAGHSAIANYAIDTGLVRALTDQGGRILPALYPETINLVPGGVFTADANADGVGDSWSLSGSGTNITPSRVDPIATDNLKGKWQQLAQAAGGVGNRWVQAQLPSTPGTPAGGDANGDGVRDGWQPGDDLTMSMRLQTEGIAANVGNASVSLGIVFIVGATTQKGFGFARGDIVDGLWSLRFTVPAGTTAAYMRATLGATTALVTPTKLRIGEVTTRNLTALALPSTN